MMGDTTPRRSLQYLSGDNECAMVLSLTVLVRWTIAKSDSLDRIPVEEVRLDE